MTKTLKQKLNERITCEGFAELINNDADQFSKAIEYATSDEHPVNWRAAWVLNHCVVKNDKRLIGYLDNLINAVKDKRDGHQRELLKLIERFDLDEEHESILFDTCLTIWQEIYKSPGTRIIAFRFLVKMVKKYPELIGEIDHLTQNHYTALLSPGIKNQFKRIISEINISNH